MKYLLVRLERKAIKTVPEKPRAKLSALMVRIKADRFGPALFRYKKNRFVVANLSLIHISEPTRPY